MKQQLWLIYIAHIKAKYRKMSTYRQNTGKYLSLLNYCYLPSPYPYFWNLTVIFLLTLYKCNTNKITRRSFGCFHCIYSIYLLPQPGYAFTVNHWSCVADFLQYSHELNLRLNYLHDTKNWHILGNSLKKVSTGQGILEDRVS